MSTVLLCNLVNAQAHVNAYDNHFKPKEVLFYTETANECKLLCVE